MQNEIFLVSYYWSLFVRHPLRWIVPMVLVLAVGGLVVMQSDRTFQSTARVSAQSQQPTTTSLVQTTVTSERVQFFEQRVFARENMVALAERLDLFPGLRATATDAELADLVRRLISLQIAPIDPSNPGTSSAMVTIGFSAPTPELAAAGAGEVVEMLIMENRNARLSEATQLRTFLEQEVVSRREQAVSLDAERETFMSINEALLPSRLGLYTTEMQELQQELQTIQVASATLSSDTRVLEAQIALAARPEAGEEGQLATLREELSTKQTVFADTHPEIVSLRSRIAALEASLAQIEAEPAPQIVEPITAQSAEQAMLAQRVASAERQQDAYTDRRNRINERLDWLRDKMAQMPTVEANLLALERRHTAAEDSLADMQNRLDTALVGERLETAQMDSQITIIDEPDVPTYPTGSGRSRAMIIAAALALGLGLGCAILWDVFDRTIKSKRELLSIMEGGDLVVIPAWQPDGRKGVGGVTAAVVCLMVLGTAAAPVPVPQGSTLEWNVMSRATAEQET
jgi:uncharacterized protein involved in exopolysaccharide biosynthesis